MEKAQKAMTDGEEQRRFKKLARKSNWFRHQPFSLKKRERRRMPVR